MKAWESAAEAGVRLQQECAQWMHHLFCEPSTLTEKGQKMMREAIIKSQHNIDEAIRLINQQAEASLKLVQKALESRGAEANVLEPARITRWWPVALDSMRVTNQTLLMANSRVLSTWSEMARKLNSDAGDTMSELAAKTSEHAKQMAKLSVDRFKELVSEGQVDLMALHRDLQDISGKIKSPARPGVAPSRPADDAALVVQGS